MEKNEKKTMSKTQKLKITLGVVAFVMIMAVIVWIIALAAMSRDAGTEVYAAEFDYVDDTMYDNAYIAMSGGQWRLYRGGASISPRAFGSLEYVEDGGYFSFINTDGKGWGYLDTSGAIIVEFNQEYQSLLPSGRTTLVGIRQTEGEYYVRNGASRTRHGKGRIIGYDEFEEFYNAYGDKYVVIDGDKGYTAAYLTSDYTECTSPLFTSLRSDVYSANGYLTVDYVTYDSDLKAVEYLNGLTPKSVGRAEFYEVVGGRAVAYRGTSGSRTCHISANRSFSVSETARVILTDGKSAVIEDEGGYSYFDGSSTSAIELIEKMDLTGGEVSVFGTSSGAITVDASGGVIKSEVSPERVTLYRTKEKNRAHYTLELSYLLIDGTLYGYEGGALKKLLEGVESVSHAPTHDSSRIVTRTADSLVIYDSFFKQTYSKTGMADAKIIDAYLPVTSSGGKVNMPRGEFELEERCEVQIVYCTDTDNYFAVTRSLREQEQPYTVYGKNGAKLGSFATDSEIEFVVTSPSQIVIFGEREINFVTRNKVLNVSYDEIYFSEKNKYALAIRRDSLSVINLNDASVTEERYISEGMEIVDKNENTFMLRGEKNGLYGIIHEGRMTLSPTFAYMELHDDFVIASVGPEGAATYFQADFYGKRLGKAYYALESTEGLTMGMNEVGYMEITDARGKVILKDVTFVPRTEGGFEFMKCKVYDEEIGKTVYAERRDNALLVVTAGGCKRVISISIS